MRWSTGALVYVVLLGQRLPGLRFQSDQPIAYLPNLLLRGPQQLLLAWDPPGA